MGFSPMQDVPTDDKQAESTLRHERPVITGNSLCGIYRCKRALGLSVLEAYMAALQAHLDVFEKARRKEEVNANNETDNS